jgi:hypothetical protein
MMTMLHVLIVWHDFSTLKRIISLRDVVPSKEALLQDGTGAAGACCTHDIHDRTLFQCPEVGLQLRQQLILTTCQSLW